MKMVKGLLLAGAAGIAAVSGAQAADLPVKARAAEYVKVCSAYGAGFFYIPGTDTCIKIGGYIWAEYDFNSRGSHGPFWNGGLAKDNRADTPAYQNRVRSEVSFDTRTQTEYGTLRSFIRFGPELNSDQGDALGGYRGTVQFSRAFIQFAGFTIGKTQSFFDFYAGALSYTTPVYAGSVSGSGHNLIAYTMQFGGGFSATISAEETGTRRISLLNSLAGNTGILNGATLGQTAGTQTMAYGYYRAQVYPDIVANLRLDQPWGSAQIMGAIHDVSAGCFPNCDVVGGRLGNATGYAIGGGIKFNLPFAPGDELWIQGTYADGATSYLGPYKPYGQDNFASFSGNRFASGLVTDGVVLGNGSVETTKGYQFTVAAQHFWTPSLRTSVFGGYMKIDYSTNGTAHVCGMLVQKTGPGTTGTCNPDFALWQVGTRTIWSPVANLDIGVEVLYSKIDQNHTGTWNLAPGGGRATGAYDAADQGIWTGNFRVTRSFWP